MGDSRLRKERRGWADSGWGQQGKCFRFELRSLAEIGCCLEKCCKVSRDLWRGQCTCLLPVFLSPGGVFNVRWPVPPARV